MPQLAHCCCCRAGYWHYSCPRSSFLCPSPSLVSSAGQSSRCRKCPSYVFFSPRPRAPPFAFHDVIRQSPHLAPTTRHPRRLQRSRHTCPFLKKKKKPRWKPKTFSSSSKLCLRPGGTPFVLPRTPCPLGEWSLTQARPSLSLRALIHVRRPRFSCP